MAGGIVESGKQKGEVSAYAGVPGSSFNTTDAVKPKGHGDCSRYFLPVDGTKELEFLRSHMTERAHFRDTELSFHLRHHPFRYKSHVGPSTYSLELIDRLNVSTN